jgi:hypothetical protein
LTFVKICPHTQAGLRPGARLRTLAMPVYFGRLVDRWVTARPSLSTGHCLMARRSQVLSCCSRRAMGCRCKRGGRPALGAAPSAHWALRGNSGRQPTSCGAAPSAHEGLGECWGGQPTSYGAAPSAHGGLRECGGGQPTSCGAAPSSHGALRECWGGQPTSCGAAPSAHPPI